MDGVPNISHAPIVPGRVFVYEYPLLQSGTYWYHSHYQLQEQIGLGGPVLAAGSPTLPADKSIKTPPAVSPPGCCVRPVKSLKSIFPEKDVLQEKIELAYSLGCDVAIHAIGDLAVTNALQSIAAARKQYPGDHRDRLEHMQLYQPQDLSFFSRSGGGGISTAGVYPDGLGTGRSTLGTAKISLRLCLEIHA